MRKEDAIKYQQEVVDEVKRLSNDIRYQAKITDVDHPEKINPYVVALLIGENNHILSRRSELFNGDHAEYNLFLQKLRGEDHSSDTLFVSLEPCNHDSRLSTISCSELIVKAGIKKVYMGTFDPDPMVRGDGYCYLVKDNKVDVELFEEKFQAELIKINSKFYYEKIENNESMRRFLNKYKDNIDIHSIALFNVATSEPGLLNKDIAYIDESLEKYLSQHKEDLYQLFYKNSIDNFFINPIVIDSRRDFWIDDGFKIAFYKKPSAYFKGAYFRIIDNTTSEEIESETFKGPIFYSLIRTYMAINEIAKKITVNPLFMETVREMLVNATCHKNYNSYSPIIVKISKDDIRISNPVINEKIDLESLNSFSMPTNPVNGCLADIAIESHFMEGQGRGSETIKEYLKSIKSDDRNVYELVCDILTTTIPFEK